MFNKLKIINIKNNSNNCKKPKAYKYFKSLMVLQVFYFNLDFKK